MDPVQETGIPVAARHHGPAGRILIAGLFAALLLLMVSGAGLVGWMAATGRPVVLALGAREIHIGPPDPTRLSYFSHKPALRLGQSRPPGPGVYVCSNTGNARVDLGVVGIAVWECQAQPLPGTFTLPLPPASPTVPPTSTITP
jgi:hypothetical protein